MCLHHILPKNKKKEILDKITRKGITVYKVARARDGKLIPPYGVQKPYEGTMEAKQIKLEVGNETITGKGYMSGFHFFMTPAAAR